MEDNKGVREPGEEGKWHKTQLRLYSCNQRWQLILKLLLKLNLTSPAAISVFPFIHRFKHGLLDRLSYLISCLWFYSKTDMPKTNKQGVGCKWSLLFRLCWHICPDVMQSRKCHFLNIPGFHRSQNENMIALRFKYLFPTSKLSAKAKRRIFFLPYETIFRHFAH